MFTLTESENPKHCGGGIAIHRARMGELGLVYRFETEDGFFLMSEAEIKARIEKKN